MIGYNPDRVKDRDKHNFWIVLSTIGYAVVWTVIAIVFYVILSRAGKLEGENISGHPLLREERAF